MQSQVETTEAKCSDILQSSSVSVVVTDLEYWSRHRRDSAFFGPGSGVKNVWKSGIGFTLCFRE